MRKHLNIGGSLGLVLSFDLCHVLIIDYTLVYTGSSSCVLTFSNPLLNLQVIQENISILLSHFFLCWRYFGISFSIVSCQSVRSVYGLYLYPWQLHFHLGAGKSRTNKKKFFNSDFFINIAFITAKNLRNIYL